MSRNQTSILEPHILERFKVIKKLGSGAYGHVYKVQDKQSLQIYALKKIFDAFQHSTDAQRTFREIEVLQQANHPNIIKLYQTFPAQNNQDVYLLFQYMESDLHNAILDNIMKDVHFRFITYQIAKALKYLHSAQAIHRDLKPSNILVNSDCKVKLCDFGLVRSLANLKQKDYVLTQGVATRWYRAPEVLLGSKTYSTPADIWSLGCIIYEMVERKPLFPGNSTTDQLDRILNFTGLPSQQDIETIGSSKAINMIKQNRVTQSNRKDQLMKNLNDQFRDLLQRVLVFNPKKRLTIKQILDHSLFKFFRKQQEQINSIKVITTSIDDNKKLSVEEYRNMIYKKSIRSENLINLNLQRKASKVTQNATDHNTIKKVKSCKDISHFPQQIILKTNLKSPETKKISWKELIKNSPNFKSPAKQLKKKNEIQQQNLESQKTVADRDQLHEENYINNRGRSPLFSPNEAKKSLKQFLWESPVKKKTKQISELGSPKQFSKRLY